MKLDEISIESFGKLTRLQIDFHPRLNIIFGPNETGKSTLQQALLHLLYGFFQSKRATPAEKELLNRFQPWQADTYSGKLAYQLQDGRSFQVSRNFADPDIPTFIFDPLTGEDITGQFTVKRHGNISFLKEQIGLDKDIFEATVFVKQAEVKAIAGSGHLVNEILGVLDSGSRDRSARKAIDHLQQEITRIGSDRAQKKPLPQAKDQLQKLQQEFEAQFQARQELKSAIEQKTELEKLLETENARRIEINYLILNKNIELKEKQLNRLKFLRQEKTKLAAKMSEFEDVKDFQGEVRDTVMRRLNNKKNYEEQIKEKSDLISELKSKNRELDEKLKPFRNYQDVQPHMSHAEFYKLSREWKRRDEAFQQLQHSLDEQEIALLEDGVEPKTLQELKDLTPADISKFSQSEENLKSLQSQQNQLTEQLTRLERNTWATGSARRFIIFGTTVTTLIAVLLSYYFKFIYGYPAAAGLLLVGLIAFSLHRKAREKIAAAANQLENQLYSLKNEAGELEFDIRHQYQRFGVDSLSKLMTRRMQNEQYLNLATKRDDALKERDRVEFQILKYLQSVNVEKLDDQIIERVDHEYRRFDEIFKVKQAVDQELAQAEKSLESLNHRLQDNETALQELFARSGFKVESTKNAEAEFDRLNNRYKELNTLKRQSDKLESEISGLLASQTEEEILKSLDELMSRRQKLLTNYPAVQGKQSHKTLQTLQNSYDEVDKSRQEHEKQIQALQTRIETVLEQHRPQADIEEDMAIVEAEIRMLERQRKILETAREILSDVALAYHRNAVPFINTVLSDSMSLISDKRYSAIKVNPNDLSLNVVYPEKQVPGSSELLSLGTQEQLYLLLRIALAQLLSQNMEPLPLILDDPFVHFDHLRMANMLKFLADLSEKNQIIIFTKEPFIVDWCREQLNESSFKEFDLQSYDRVSRSSDRTS